MKKTSKTFQSNIDLAPNETFGINSTREIYSEYFNRKTDLRVQMSNEWAKTTGDALVTYAELPSTSRIPPFYLKLGMTHKTWYTAVKTYKYLKESLEEAKDIIGTRRERDGKDKDKEFQLNSSLVPLSIDRYLIEYQEIIKERHEYEKELIPLKAEAMKDANQKGDVNITIERQTTPNSDLVRDFKKKEDDDR